MTETPTARIDAHTLADIDRSLVRGVAWMGLIKWSGQIVAWLSTMVVLRLLSPYDYGLVGMATLYLGFLTAVSEFGIGAAIVTLRTLPDEHIRQINTVSVIFGSVGYLLSCALAKPIGAFFHRRELPLVIVVLSTTFVIASFRSVPWALLQRDMRFKRVAAFEGVQVVVLAIASVAFAALGLRYWTLVIASVLSSLITTGFALTLHRVAFARPKWGELRRALSFSREVIVQRIAWYTYSNADFFVAGRVLGVEPLGAYEAGWTLANTPIDKIGTLVLQVTPSILSAVQSDRTAVARYVLALTEGIAVVLFPLLIGLAIVAPEFVPLAIGPQWRAMILPLQLLSVYSCFRCILPLLAQVLMITGDEKFASHNMILGALIMPVAFYAGSKLGGVTGIALAWVLVHPLLAFRLCRRALGRLGIGAIPFMRSLWPAVSGCLLMSAAVFATRAACPGMWPTVVRLLLEVSIGVIAYAATLLGPHHRRVNELRTFVTTMRATRV